MAGSQASCPTCNGVVQISAEAFQAGDEPPSAPIPTQAQNMSCPVCAGLFQIAPQMAGQEVLCPVCQARVTVPDSEPNTQATQDEATQPAQSSVSVYDPPTLPRKDTSADDAPLPTIDADSHDAAIDAYTPPSLPGASPPADPSSNPARVVEQHKLPPRPQQTADPPASAPQTAAPVDPAPPASQPTSPEPSIDPQQPVATAAQAPMPPTSADPMAPADIRVAPDPQQPEIAAQSPVAEPANAANPPADVPVALDPDTGQPIQIHDAPVTVRRGDQVIELRRLTPKEKSRRRMIKNLIVIAICASVIIGYLALTVDWETVWGK